ncbi:MAG: hypothetical protein AAB412_01635 [Elusimicrobiota bacterium]
MKITQWGREAISAQEIVFSISMGTVAVLGRENPSFALPGILWVFAALLAFNLGYHLFLRRDASWVVPLVSIAVNTVLISAALAYSGGSDSYFWPMYLLPIFTACLHLEARHSVFAVAASCAFLSYFYIDQFFSGPVWSLVELGVKLGVLVLSGGVTMQIAGRERKTRRALEATREDLDRLAQAIEASDPSGGRAASRGKFLDGVLYDLHSRLLAVMGSAEVLLEQVPSGSELRPDIERIGSSVHSLHRLTSDFLDLTRSAESHKTDVSLEKALAQVAALLDFKLKHRDLTLSMDLPKDLPPVHQSRAHLQVALLDLMLWVLEHTASGGRVRVKAGHSRKGVDLTLSLSARVSAEAGDTLAVHAQILALHQAQLKAVEAGDGLELVLTFSPRERKASAKV